ncbi:unnamed protein product [Ceratitis capitata]|uniref:(Mediterranean fruit fly) hypothetical protein n=1 Tax=Ceratitis capitata TaxID=7213 RepID=A0A811TY15_CERCA|nr:unnamed protein product [Ceratitis capitata]
MNVGYYVLVVGLKLLFCCDNSDTQTDECLRLIQHASSSSVATSSTVLSSSRIINYVQSVQYVQAVYIMYLYMCVNIYLQKWCAIVRRNKRNRLTAFVNFVYVPCKES